MKTLLLLTLFAVNAISSPIDNFSEDTRINGENGWYVPQLDGSFVWVDEDEAESYFETMESMEERALSTCPVTFYLYTNKNPKKGTKITATVKSISASNFDAANPTRIVIHGWTQSYKAGMNKDITEAWLSLGNYNVIIVDWGRARSVDYATSVLAVGKVGKKVAKLVDFLVTNYDLDLNNLHVIGHSLGAHVAGYTGKNVKTGQVHTIVGLDTALPLFSYKKPKKRLSNNDAYYVESIHTNGDKLGFLQPIGKGAFYPNGGKEQPGCGWDLTGACSHGRSTTYYAEAVKNNAFPSMKCEKYQDAVKNTCGSTYGSVHMGSTTNAYVVSGEYYVPVNNQSPFGMAA